MCSKDCECTLKNDDSTNRSYSAKGAKSIYDCDEEYTENSPLGANLLFEYLEKVFDCSGFCKKA